MKYIILLLLFCTSLFAQTSHSVIVKNSTDIERKDVVVEILLQQIFKTESVRHTTDNFIVTDKKGIEYVYQIVANKDSTAFSVLVQVSLGKQKSLQLFFREGKHKVFIPKTYCKFVPERFDDFAWENDKIAFRTYGPALEKTNQNGKGFDVWSKRTSNLIIDKWYASKDYHTDKGEGCDMYKVGYSLGAGDAAIFMNDSIVLSPNFSQYKMITQGSLRCVFELTYPPFKAFEQTVNIHKRISLDAGSQFNRIDLTINTSADSSQAVVGIVRRHHAGINLLDEQAGIMTYWEPATEHDGLVAVACILPQQDYDMAIKQGHLLAPIRLHNQQTFSYHAGASWNKAQRITNSKQWIDFVYQTQQTIAQPLQIIAP